MSKEYTKIENDLIEEIADEVTKKCLDNSLLIPRLVISCVAFKYSIVNAIKKEIEKIEVAGI